MMRKIIYTLMAITAFIFIVPSVHADAAIKTYTISESTKAPAKYSKLATYNEKTKDYYVFRDVFETCAKNNGGKIVIKKGEYIITNPIYISSNTTVVLEDGVIIKKGSETGTSKLKASLSIFQLINPMYAKVDSHYSGYTGEHDITILGEGNATLDIDYVERGLGIVIGHNTNVTVKNIQFKNMNGGHFIEMDASDNTLVDGCTFENAKEWGKSAFKEAINVDTPDLVTKGFNNIWSSHDKTPNKNTHITNCTFKNLESGVGTHGVSKTQNPDTGLYDINQWHSSVTIDYCKFINISRTCLRVYGWKDFVVENNEFTNEIKYSGCSIFEGWCVSNPSFRKNNMNNFKTIGTILTINYFTKKDGVIVKVPGQDYEPNYSYLYEQNVTDFYNNSATNMDDARIYIQKGIKTTFPETNITISGNEMKLQEAD
ncbi:MAG: right handed beta helix region family protein [Firmicutes bacterium]|nr:right handed beta helix region family protein [Bacillota bacterium]